MYECALQFTKFYVSKTALDCIALMEKVLLQACESVLTMEIPRSEEKDPMLHPDAHFLLQGSGPKPIMQMEPGAAHAKKPWGFGSQKTQNKTP